MSVIFAVPTVQESIGTFGTFSQLGKLRIWPENVENASVRIILAVVKPDKSEAKFVCSPRVSAALRAQELHLGDLDDLPVTEQTSEKGEKINVIAMDAQDRSVIIDRKNLTKTTKVPAKPKTIKDLEGKIGF